MTDYSFENNTYSFTPKDEVRDRISVEIGDSKQPVFYPQVKIMRWDNEVNLSYRLIDHVDGAVSAQDGKIIWSKDKTEINFYEVPVSEDHPEGGYEFDIILKEKPKSNKIDFSINTKGIVFYYQPPLTKEEVDRGHHRPENVVGAYAVYMETPGTNYVGQTLYKTGQVGMIYRPKIYDSDGKTTWGDIHIDTDNGILSVEIPQDFLDNAVYPIRNSAGLIFGYNTIGSSTYDDSMLNYLDAMYGVPASSGTVDTVKIYTRRPTAGTTNGKGLVVLGSNENILTNGITPAFAMNSTTAQWWTATYVSKPSVTASTVYYVGWIADGNVRWYYNAGSATNLVDTSNNYTTPTNPTDATYENYSMSYYAEYTAAGTAYSQSCAESLSTSDSLGKVWAAIRNLAESSSISDSFLHTWAAQRTLPESASISDAVLQLLIAQRYLGESITLSDSLSVSSAFVSLLTESSSISDSIASTWDIYRMLPESVSIADSISTLSSIIETLSESVSFSDDLSHVWVSQRDLGESLGVSDSLSMVWEAYITSSESLSASDSLLKSEIKPMTESISISESFDHTWTSIIELAESLSIADSLITQFSGAGELTLTESISISDSLSRVWTAIRLISESLSISDSLIASTGGTAWSETLTETLLILDNLVIDVYITEIGTGILIADSIIKGIYLYKTENLSVSFQLERLWTATITFSESISISDSLSALNVVIRTLAESLSISDALVTLSTSQRVLSESIGISFDLLTYWTAQRFLTETLSIADSLTTFRVTIISLSESLNITMYLPAFSVSINRILTESINITLGLKWIGILGRISRRFGSFLSDDISDTFDTEKSILTDDIVIRKEW